MVGMLYTNITTNKEKEKKKKRKRRGKKLMENKEVGVDVFFLHFVQL